jgi:hypothetical protein
MELVQVGCVCPLRSARRAVKVAPRARSHPIVSASQCVVPINFGRTTRRPWWGHPADPSVPSSGSCPCGPAPAPEDDLLPAPKADREVVEYLAVLNRAWTLVCSSASSCGNWRIPHPIPSGRRASFPTRWKLGHLCPTRQLAGRVTVPRRAGYADQERI